MARTDGTDHRLGTTAVPHSQNLAHLLSEVRKRVPDLDEDAVFSSLWTIELCTRALYAVSRHFGRYGLSQARFTLLMFLFHYPDRPWTPASLAEVIRVRRPTVTNLLKVLERDGWITRYPDATDGRKKLIALSQQGRDRFPAIMEDHFDRIGHVFGAEEFHVPSAAQKKLQGIATAFERLAGGQ
jgi:DNA-binding MarR family transcriptional regulator